jgi:hypothetical protein
VWRGVRRRALRPALLLGGLQTARLAEPPTELAVTNPRRCPRCDSAEVVPIRSSYPGPKMVEDSFAGRVLLGGCVIHPDFPHWRCLDCGHEGQSGEAWASGYSPD